MMKLALVLLMVGLMFSNPVFSVEDEHGAADAEILVFDASDVVFTEAGDVFDKFCPPGQNPDMALLPSPGDPLYVNGFATVHDACI